MSGVYAGWRGGVMMPSAPTLRRMCEILGISSDALLSLRQCSILPGDGTAHSPGAASSRR